MAGEVHVRHDGRGLRVDGEPALGGQWHHGPESAERFARHWALWGWTIHYALFACGLKAIAVGRGPADWTFGFGLMMGAALFRWRLDDERGRE